LNFGYLFDIWNSDSVNVNLLAIMASYTPPNEKADMVEAEMGNTSGTDRLGEVEHIKGLATAPGTTRDSFSHLDEKKILRKVCSPRSSPNSPC
jgi:hypothetical protein